MFQLLARLIKTEVSAPRHTVVPGQVEVKGLAHRHGSPCLLMTVPTSKGNVFMRIDRSQCDSEKFVVIVEARAFARLWNFSVEDKEYRPLRAGPATWHLDRKFHKAAEGFEQGESDPVPLARVSCLDAPGRQIPSVSFVDGITRTLWLLAHGAPAFPVECAAKNGPHNLPRLAGVQNGGPWLAAELFKKVEV